MKRVRHDRRGFAILAVVILLAIMTGVTATALDESVSAIQANSGVRAAEMIKSSLDHGLGQAINRVQAEDVTVLVDPSVTWDIFDRAVPVGSSEYLGPFAYPASGPYRGQYRVRIGLRPGQRTRAPAGEDVRNMYGQIVEIQIGVDATSPGTPPAEDRVSIGVLVPRQRSGAN